MLYGIITETLRLSSDTAHSVNFMGFETVVTTKDPSADLSLTCLNKTFECLSDGVCNVVPQWHAPQVCSLADGCHELTVE
jgi:hypothetical protein